jgi:hypothetical protein
MTQKDSVLSEVLPSIQTQIEIQASPRDKSHLQTQPIFHLFQSSNLHLPQTSPNRFQKSSIAFIILTRSCAFVNEINRSVEKSINSM